MGQETGQGEGPLVRGEPGHGQEFTQGGVRGELPCVRQEHQGQGGGQGFGEGGQVEDWSPAVTAGASGSRETRPTAACHCSSPSQPHQGGGRGVNALLQAVFQELVSGVKRSGMVAVSHQELIGRTARAEIMAATGRPIPEGDPAGRPY